MYLEHLAEDSQTQNDISVTKFLYGEEEHNPTTSTHHAVSHYLNGPNFTVEEKGQENDISVTKFLGQQANDIVITMFNLETGVDNYLLDNNITVIEFLDTVLPLYLEQNDISVTKFLDETTQDYMALNDISVTKFLEQDYGNDISVTKFLSASGDQQSNWLGQGHQRGAYRRNGHRDD